MSFYEGVCQPQGLEGWDSECRTRERLVGRVGSVKGRETEVDIRQCGFLCFYDL